MFHDVLCFMNYFAGTIETLEDRDTIDFFASFNFTSKQMALAPGNPT